MKNKKEKTIKVYYDNFTQSHGEYGLWHAYNPEFHVFDMTEQEALEFANEMYDRGIEVFVIDYKAEKGIGALARHINQCYGRGVDSFYRSLELRNRMRAYIKRNGFRAIIPIMKEAK